MIKHTPTRADRDVSVHTASSPTEGGNLGFLIEQTDATLTDFETVDPTELSSGDTISDEVIRESFHVISKEITTDGDEVALLESECGAWVRVKRPNAPIDRENPFGRTNRWVVIRACEGL